MTNRTTPSAHNGESHSKTQTRHASSRPSRKTSLLRFSEAPPAYRYGIPAAGAAIVGLAATGIVLREQLAAVLRTAAKSMRVDNLLELIGLERRRSFAVRFGPTIGALALGLCAGTGATYIYTRTISLRDHEAKLNIGGATDESSIDIAP